MALVSVAPDRTVLDLDTYDPSWDAEDLSKFIRKNIRLDSTSFSDFIHLLSDIAREKADTLAGNGTAEAMEWRDRAGVLEVLGELWEQH